MPNLTTRKIIRFGKSTLAMTLPKAWANYFQLRAGDRLEVIANRNSENTVGLRQVYWGCETKDDAPVQKPS